MSKQENRTGQTQKILLSFLFYFGLVSCLFFFTACTDHATKKITVSAATSLITAFDKLKVSFQEKTGIQVIYNFASSGKLSQQIEHGALVDVFASANTSYISRLAKEKIIDPDSVRSYASGRLVYFSRQAGLIPSKAKELDRTAIERIAIANPEHAPYGVMARIVLKNNKLWDRLQHKLILADTVRQALSYAETGDVSVAVIPLSLVIHLEKGAYRLIPESQHEPLIQSIGIVKQGSNKKEAQAFIEFVLSDQGQSILRKYGYQPVR